MTRPRFKKLNIFFYIAIILADLLVYIFLGTLFMGYEDFYDESEGPWMSLQSMTTREKVIYFAIDIWYIVNILLILWLTYRAIKWYRQYGLTRNKV